jgi:hypothetical protein
VRKCDVTAELAWREELSFRIAQHHCRLALMFPAAATASSLLPEDGQPSQCILPFLNLSASAGRRDTFALLDDVAASASSPAITARTLACIADLLSAWAAGKGGLRSGPGRNTSFAHAVEVRGRVGSVYLSILPFSSLCVFFVFISFPLISHLSLSFPLISLSSLFPPFPCSSCWRTATSRRAWRR